MTQAQIITAVRTIINEVENTNGLAKVSPSPDALNLDYTITTLIPPAVCICSALSPVGGVNAVTNRRINFGNSNDLSVPTNPTGTNLYTGSSFTTYILPDDFIRLNAMDIYTNSSPIVYHRPITRLYSLEDELGKAQWNEHTKSGKDNPVGVELWCGTDRCVELFPQLDGDRVEISYDGAYSTALSNVTMALGYAVCYMVASLFFETMEEGDSADRMREIAMNYLGVEEKRNK